jgi:hypothetical protein
MFGTERWPFRFQEKFTLGAALRAKKFRRRAEICMRLAGQVSDPDRAQRLRLMASEYLVNAEEAESEVAAGAPVAEDPPLSLGTGESFPSANPEPPTK